MGQEIHCLLKSTLINYSRVVKDSKEPFVSVQYGTIWFNSVEFVTVLFNVKFMFV